MSSRQDRGGHLGDDSQENLAAAAGGTGQNCLDDPVRGARPPAPKTKRRGHQRPETHHHAAPAGEGAAGNPVEPKVPLPPLADSYQLLIDLGGQRRFAIKMQIRIDNAVRARVAGALGYWSGAAEAERTKLYARATRLIAAVQAGATPPDDEALPAGVAAEIVLAARSRAPWDELRAGVEKEMRRAARGLPVWPWVAAVRGFGDLALAVIVAEAGALDRYANPGKLWKRLGLAPIEKGGETRAASQWRRAGGLEAADWTAAGYAPQRRAQVWAFLDDAMLRHQIQGARDGAPAAARGPYGAAYLRKKSEYVERGWTLGHAHAAARRYGTKCAIRDLWVAWRAADERVKTSTSLPPADLSADASAPDVAA